MNNHTSPSGQPREGKTSRAAVIVGGLASVAVIVLFAVIAFAVKAVLIVPKHTSKTTATALGPLLVTIVVSAFACLLLGAAGIVLSRRSEQNTLATQH